jgi:hypothetical protein
MKPLNLLYLILLSFQIQAQNLYLKLEPQEDGNNFLIMDMKNNIHKKVFCSYSVLKGTMIDYMTDWGVGSDGVIYWTNGENIYKFNAKNGISKVVASRLYSVLELAVRDSFAFVAYNPLNPDAPGDGRYAGGLKLIRINLKNETRVEIKLPPAMNITNLDVSTDGRIISFVDTRDIDMEKRTKYFFRTYDTENKQLKTIDTAVFYNYERFGDVDDFNGSQWINNKNFVYYKKEGKDSFGTIFLFDHATNSRRKILAKFPVRDFTWFAYYQENCFLSHRNQVYTISDGINKKIVYSGKEDIMEGLIL